MRIIRITSPDDERIADYRNVPDPELVHRRGLFVGENRLVVRDLLASNRFRLRSLLLTDAALENLRDVVERRGETIDIYVCDRSLMLPIAGFNIHRGCLALGERPAQVTLTDWLASNPSAERLVVLEGVTNADNIGGIFRTARAFGVDAVVLGPRCCDPLYRKAIRVSIGATLDVPFATMSRWPDDLHLLGASGFTLLALTLSADAVNLEQGITSYGRKRVAIIAGNEGDGLSAEAERHADARVRIPMAHGVDSLNVGTSVAIALYRLTCV